MPVRESGAEGSSRIPGEDRAERRQGRRQRAGWPGQDGEDVARRAVSSRTRGDPEAVVEEAGDVVSAWGRRHCLGKYPKV
jgi:hypothetical protein